MVAESPLPMKWKLTNQEVGAVNDSLGSLSNKLGSSMQSMVSTGEDNAHQLSEAAGSLLGSEDLPKRSSISQQPGGIVSTQLVSLVKSL